MTKKIKNRQKQNFKRLIKQKKRQLNLRKQAFSRRPNSQSDVEEMVDHAMEKVEAGDLKGAARILDRLKKKHNNHSHVNYGLGVLSAFNNDVDDAICYFELATQIEPTLAAAHYNLAVAYQKQLKVPEMISTYRKVVQIGDPDDYCVQDAQDFLEKMERHMRESNGIGLDEFLEGNRIFEQGMKYMESADWEAAIIEFERSSKIAPNYIQPYGNLGICYASLGKKQQALDAFDKALQLDPAYEPAMVNRKLVELLKEGESLKLKVKAIEYYKDYALTDRSYVKEYLESQNLLPG